MDKKLKVGQRVVALVDVGDRGKKGEKGTIRVIKNRWGGEDIGVSFDKNIEGHNLDGASRENCGWWLNKESLKVITGKGKIEYPEYLLKYDLDTDPIEMLWTLEDAKKRINELVHKHGKVLRSDVSVFKIKVEKEINLKVTSKLSVKVKGF